MPALRVGISEKGETVTACIVGRDPWGRFCSLSISAEMPGERFRGKTMREWMEMFARDEQILAGMLRAIEARRASGERLQEWRRCQEKKPVVSEPIKLELSLEAEQAKRVRRMMQLAGKVRCA